ncbi:MAG TPA: diaminopimelate decarboxylase, partial [bacterium]|nr:diaminopimelate decarboxylase [bacterium]
MADTRQAVDERQEVLLGEVHGGTLVIGGVPAPRLAAEFGTPLYVMDEDRIRQRCRDYVGAVREHYPNSQVVYASKAFCCMAMCRLAHEEGLYLDVVSPGELVTALRAGVPAARLLVHGNNKTPQELQEALEAGVGRIVLDNFYDVELLDVLTRETGRTADVLLRLTPGIEPHTHRAIRTGGVDSKFGFGILGGTARDAVARTLAVPGLRLRGIHCHIGSQILDLEPFVQSTEAMVEFAAWMAQDHKVAIEDLDLGGGPGVRYLPHEQPLEIDEFVAAVTQVVRR